LQKGDSHSFLSHFQNLLHNVSYKKFYYSDSIGFVCAWENISSMKWTWCSQTFFFSFYIIYLIYLIKFEVTSREKRKSNWEIEMYYWFILYETIYFTFLETRFSWEEIRYLSLLYKTTECCVDVIIILYKTWIK
jgi:hypothetical protein